MFFGLRQDAHSGQTENSLQLMPSSKEWDGKPTSHVDEKLESEEGFSFSRKLKRQMLDGGMLEKRDIRSKLNVHGNGHDQHELAQLYATSVHELPVGEVQSEGE